MEANSPKDGTGTSCGETELIRNGKRKSHCCRRHLLQEASLNPLLAILCHTIYNPRSPLCSEESMSSLGGEGGGRGKAQAAWHPLGPTKGGKCEPQVCPPSGLAPSAPGSTCLFVFCLSSSWSSHPWSQPSHKPGRGTTGTLRISAVCPIFVLNVRAGVLTTAGHGPSTNPPGNGPFLYRHYLSDLSMNLALSAPDPCVYEIL